MFVTRIVSTTEGLSDLIEDEQTTVLMTAQDIHDMNVRTIDDLRMTLIDIKPDNCTIIWDTFVHDDRSNSGRVAFIFTCTQRTCTEKHMSSFAWWYNPEDDLELSGEIPPGQVMTLQHVEDFMSRIDLGVCPATLLVDQIAEIGPDINPDKVNTANVDALIACGWFEMFATIDDGLLAIALTQDLTPFAFNRIVALAHIACSDTGMMAQILAPDPAR